MPEKFRLNILGADEDVPRLLLAYGRACGGEVAFVMRPRDNTALLVHQVKKQPAKVWRTDQGLAPSHPPEEDADPGAAVAEVKRTKANPPPAGPATLRGRWVGLLNCEDGTPSMRLERKVAAYGVLRLASKPDGRWTATFDRAPKWFSAAKQESVERTGLAEAIQAGMGLVVGLVSEACSFRDTRRRNTVDAEYAQVHPYQPPKAPKDPTERYQPRPGPAYSLREGETGFDVLDAAGNVVARFGTREKGKAQKHLRALNKGQDPGPAPTPEVTVTADVAGAFGMGGLPGVKVVPALHEIPAPEPPSCPTSVARIASATEKEAEALGELAQSLWGSTEAPERWAAQGASSSTPRPSSPRRSARARSRRRPWRTSAGRPAPTNRRGTRSAGARPRRGDHAASDHRARLARRRAGREVLRRRAGEARSGAAGGGTAFSRGTAGKPARSRKAKAPEVDPAKDKALVDAFAQAIQAAAAQMGAAS